MAKKKEITIKLNGTRSGDSPTPGDVNIFYGHTLLAGLSETAAARLETENTILIKDVGIEYTKPTSPSNPVGNTVNLSTDIVGESVQINGHFFDPNGVYSYSLEASHDAPGSGLVLCSTAPGGYNVAFILESEEDIYSMSVNDTTVTFNNGRYRFFGTPSPDPINNQTYNVVINRKQ